MRTLRRTVMLCSLLAAALALGCSGGGDRPQAGSAPAGTAAAAAAQQAQPGGRLALVHDQVVAVRDANGRERQVARTADNTFPSFPAWSPDGSRIAYVQAAIFTGQVNVDWGGDIYVIDMAGGTPTLLWKHDQPGAQVQGLAWTRDGRALLFGYQLTLIKDGKYQGQTQRVERLDLDSGRRTPLVNGGFMPTLSRDGTRMAYMTQDDTGTGGLWVAAGDGSGARQVVELGPKLLAILYPRIAPDGSAIAFAAVESQAAAPGRTPAGGGLRGALRSLLPRPAVAHGLPMDVWKVTVADGAVARLTHLSEDEPYAAWSTDGTTLTVFATGGLYQVAADGSSAKKIGRGAFGGQVDIG